MVLYGQIMRYEYLGHVTYIHTHTYTHIQVLDRGYAPPAPPGFSEQEL